MNDSPMSRSKSDYEDIIGKISHPESPVGIDAQLTHAIIIVYLQQISERLERLEARLPDEGFSLPLVCLVAYSR